jgi:Ser-tRNA(Ala) deacylase AlaX
MAIDSQKRIFNARNHSAGHLIDIAMKNIGLGYLKPTKGFHFPEGSYVEYEGDFQESPE